MSDSLHPQPPGRGTDPLTVFDPAKVEPDLRSMTRIVLRPIGSPLPLGFFTLAIDSVVVSAFQWGLLPEADHRALALIVIPAFVVQLIVGILAFLSRDSIAATLMMSFATTWLVDALVFYVRCCRSGASARPATRPTTTWPSSSATSNDRQASAGPCEGHVLGRRSACLPTEEALGLTSLERAASRPDFIESVAGRMPDGCHPRDKGHRGTARKRGERQHSRIRRRLQDLQP
jgi:GPR1/FUN34/yaaH family